MVAGIISAGLLLGGHFAHAPELSEHLGKAPMWPLRGVVEVVAVLAVYLSRAPNRARAHFWWTGAELGVVFAVLATISAEHPVGRNEPFRWGREVVHFGALGAGVPFLLLVLAAILPLILDALEGRSFSSFVGARHVRATKSGFLTVISVLSIGGVAVARARSRSVTSIMGGFSQDLKRKILGNNAHIVVDVTRPGGFGGWPEKLEVTRAALARAGGGAATPVVGGEVMASSHVEPRGRDRARHRPGDHRRRHRPQGQHRGRQVRVPRDPEKLLRPRRPTRSSASGPGGEQYLHGPDFRRSATDDIDPAAQVPRAARARCARASSSAASSRKTLHVYVGDEVTLVSPLGDLGPMGVMPRTQQVPHRGHLLQRDVRVRRDARLHRRSTRRRATSACRTTRSRRST